MQPDPSPPLSSVAPAISPAPALDRRGRWLVLGAVFLGWMFAGMEMSLMVPATRPAIQEFLAADAASITASGWNERVEVSAERWLSCYIASFLLGAALGGMLFGWLADHAGRVKAMAASICCYSLVTGLSYWAASPEQLLVLRFIACMGIGGMWPAGVALASEAWPAVSRPMLAGLIGMAANVGFLLLGILMLYFPVTRDSWRWVLLLGGAPVFLGLFVFRFVPESPGWLMEKRRVFRCGSSVSPVREVFKPPLLRLTLLGIFLGTIPLLGGWASGQRLVPWAGQVGEFTGTPQLKAWTQVTWAIGAVLGSLAGGWLAHHLGRRLSYFLMSLGALSFSALLFLGLNPVHPMFLPAVFGLGVIATSFFGWLPYFLPELFPIRARATGAGVSYNFGRILSAGAVLSSAALAGWFRGDIAKMGAVTSIIYLFGLLIIRFIPPSKKEE
jgi:MFS transporter, SHS family, sialic acid transporter